MRSAKYENALINNSLKSKKEQLLSRQILFFIFEDTAEAWILPGLARFVLWSGLLSETKVAGLKLQAYYVRGLLPATASAETYWVAPCAFTEKNSLIVLSQLEAVAFHRSLFAWGQLDRISTIRQWTLIKMPTALKKVINSLFKRAW